MGVSGQRHAPAALCPGERTPGTHCTGSWVVPRGGLDTEVRGKILCPYRGSNPVHCYQFNKIPTSHDVQIHFFHYYAYYYNIITNVLQVFLTCSA
jgi:hypothetical protein